MKHPAFRHLLKFGAAVLILAAFLISPALTGAEAKTIYVTQNGTGDKFGDSWANSYDAKRFFNSLNNDPLIKAGDEYRVAKGKYSPISTDSIINRANAFKLKSGVKLYGGFAGPGAADPDYRNLVTHETILSGELSPGINSYHVVVARGTDSTTLLDGFTVTKGIADGGGEDNNGGGLFAYNGEALIKYCTFRENTADNLGAGAYVYLKNVKFESCTFTKNTAAHSGGGVSYLIATKPTLEKCTFNENHALVDGGAIYSLQASPEITNCTFYKNTASQNGGGINSYTSSPVITNSSFFNNSATGKGSGMYSYASDPTVMNSIFWDAGTSEIFEALSPVIADVTISDSVVKDGFEDGTRIITTDPQLATLGNNGGYTLTCALPSGSSAIDKGQRVGTTVSGSVKVPGTDQREVARPQGSGVDIGAYEYVPSGEGGGGSGCQSVSPASALWLMLPLGLVLLRRRN